MKCDIMDGVLFGEYLTQKGLKDSSIYTYVITVEAFLKYNPDLDEIEDYNKFLIHNTIKKRNQHYYYAIKKFIEFKIEDKKIKQNLLDGLVKPIYKDNIKRERKYLTEDKIYQLINYLQDEKHQIIAWIQNETGVRAGDILKLKKGNIIPEEYEGTAILKLKIIGKRDRQIIASIFNPDLQETLLNYVNTHIEDNDYYFLSSSKNPKRPGSFTEDAMLKRNYWDYWQDCKEACTTMGMDVADFATHDYRRCFARRLWSRTKDLELLQKMLSHKDPATTIRYLKQSGMETIDVYRQMQMKK